MSCFLKSTQICTKMSSIWMDTVKLLVLYLATRLLLEISAVNSNVRPGSNRVTFFIFPFSIFEEIKRVVSTSEPPIIALFCHLLSAAAARQWFMPACIYLIFISKQVSQKKHQGIIEIQYLTQVTTFPLVTCYMITKT